MKQFWQRWRRRSPKQAQAPVLVPEYMPRQPFLLWRDFLAQQGATKTRQSGAFSPLFEHPLLKDTAEDVKPWLTDFCPLVDNQSAAYPLARLLGKQQAQLASALTQFRALDRSALKYYSLPQAILTSTLHSRRLPNTDRQIADELAGLHQQVYCLIRQWERVSEAEDAIDNASLQNRLRTMTTRLDGVIETMRAE